MEIERCVGRPTWKPAYGSLHICRHVGVKINKRCKMEMHLPLGAVCATACADRVQGNQTTVTMRLVSSSETAALPWHSKTQHDVASAHVSLKHGNRCILMTITMPSNFNIWNARVHMAPREIPVEKCEILHRSKRHQLHME
jgi:hypothetical protein